MLAFLFATAPLKLAKSLLDTVVVTRYGLSMNDNDLASPMNPFRAPRQEPAPRTLFAIDFPADNPTETGWNSEPYMPSSAR